MTDAEREQGLIEALKIIAAPLLGEPIGGPSAAAYRLLLAGQVVAKELGAARKALHDLREESTAYQRGRADEREECAQIAETYRGAEWMPEGATGCEISFSEGQECDAVKGIAAAIRARG